MALTFTPYRSYGLRSSFGTKYRISEGYAEILKLRLFGWRVVQRLPLEDISTKIEGTASQKFLDRGGIKITTVSGETMLWENLRKTKAVQDALYNWKTLEDTKSSQSIARYDDRFYVWNSLLMAFLIIGTPAKIRFYRKKRRQALNKESQVAKVEALSACMDLVRELRESASSSEVNSLVDETDEMYQREYNKLLSE